MKDRQAELIAQYLLLMDMQQKEINLLRKENNRLRSVNSGLKTQKTLYKESALEWRRRYEDLLESSLKGEEIKTLDGVIPETVRRALRVYESMQNSI